jgi:hypothetical protein
MFKIYLYITFERKSAKCKYLIDEKTNTVGNADKMQNLENFRFGVKCANDVGFFQWKFKKKCKISFMLTPGIFTLCSLKQ